MHETLDLSICSRAGLPPLSDESRGVGGTEYMAQDSSHECILLIHDESKDKVTTIDGSENKIQTYLNIRTSSEGNHQ